MANSVRIFDSQFNFFPNSPVSLCWGKIIVKYAVEMWKMTLFVMCGGQKLSESALSWSRRIMDSAGFQRQSAIRFIITTKRWDLNIRASVGCNAAFLWRKPETYEAINEADMGINFKVDFLSFHFSCSCNSSLLHFTTNRCRIILFVAHKSRDIQECNKALYLSMYICKKFLKLIFVKAVVV